MLLVARDMHADPTSGLISGFIYGQDQIFCGNVNSTSRRAAFHSTTA
jgi:hypothetical protein